MKNPGLDRRHVVTAAGALGLVTVITALLVYRQRVTVTMFPASCAVCGSEVLMDWQRCPYCGTMLTRATTQPTHP